jgi:hypothetical protein
MVRVQYPTPVINLPRLPQTNLYDYVRGNPINRVDPQGLWPELFGQTLFPGEKEKAEKNLPPLLKRLSPGITPGEAQSLSDAIIEELGTTDLDMAKSLQGIKDPKNLTPDQRKLIDDFLKRLPSSLMPAIDKLRAGCGIAPGGL